ncbi:MAG: efflux RND transporter permease subunit [Pirellulaceae bacterium]|nr:efflux RND transporter permease subunit [Pirellulaceae bacterium]
MKITDTAIDHPRIVIVSTVLVLAMALLAAIRIPVQLAPAISTAVIMIAVPYPGALPTEAEVQITREIEDALAGLNNVDFISSTSMRGSSVTQVMFLDGVDADTARGEVKDLVDEVRSELPDIFRNIEPSVTKIDFDNTPLMLVNIRAPEGFDQRALKEVAEEVQDEIEALAGVSTTQLFGGLEREVHVDVNVDLAAQYDLTLADVRNALSSFHAELPGGQMNTGVFDYQVRNETKLRGLEDIREVIVKQDGGRIVRIMDVANVQDTHRRLKNVAKIDGDDCATIVVYKESDINTYGTAQALKSLLKELEPQYPFVTFSATRDTSDEITLMFRVLGSSFVFGAMLVLIILGWTMGLRISFLVLTAVPLSSAVALVAAYATGIPISNMVIFSFILALGMVVDGAIIVAENIYRHVERGEEPAVAAKNGIREVGMPVIIADLTTVAAFLPMLLVPGMMGDFMGVMPKVVSMALLGSVLVDHFLIPVLASKFFRQRKPTTKQERQPEENLGFAHRFLLKTYLVLLSWALNHRWAVMTCSLLAFIWAGQMMSSIGFTFFPESDRGQFEIKYELPLGNSIEQTIAAAEIFTVPLRELAEDKRLNGRSELVHFISAIGSSEGLASRLENDPAVGPEFGTIMVQLLSPLDRNRHEAEIIEELREKFDKRLDLFPGILYSIEEVEEGPPGGSDVAIRLTGDDLEQIGNIGQSLAGKLAKTVGTLDCRSDYRPENPELIIEPDPRILGLFDISETQIAQAVLMAIHGDESIELNLNDEDIKLRIQADGRYQSAASTLGRIMLTGNTGKKATLEELGALTRNVGVYAVNRYQQTRSVTARCDVKKPNTTPDDVFAIVRANLLPQMGFEPVKGSNTVFVGQTGTISDGVRAEFTGENEERDENFRYLLFCMLIAVVLIFGMLVLQFNSFRQAIIVLLTVPLSFIGVVIGMWICSFPFSLASFIGLVSLTGIVVNDAIVVVDFINQSRRGGLPLRNALIEAGQNRLRPVLLTTITTIGGLLPLMLNLTGGAEFWQPLTGAIVFGLMFATALTLVVIPVAYSLVYNSDFRRAEI